MEIIKEKSFSFQLTTALKKILALSKRIRAVKGGTSASKTISILLWFIDYAQNKDHGDDINSIVSESFPHLSLGAIRDFKAIMKDRGYWKEDRWNATNHFYTFETGGIIEFMSMDTYGKAHGPRRKNLFLNECNNLPWKIVDQLIMRTKGVVFMDWNPVEEFWFHTEIEPFRDDFEYITLTYLDNEALDEVTVKEIESHKHNEQWWQVYGMGQDGVTETRVFPDWQILAEVPAEARLRRKGLDFGYAKDPTALVDIYEWEKGFILDEQLYEKEYTNDMIAKKIGKNQELTVADSSEPKSIREIALHGVLVIGSKKGKGSISHGLDAMRSRKIYVTKQSLNIIKENRNYKYKMDKKTGKILNEPEDILNHAMDAARYAIADLLPDDIDEEDEYVPEEHEYPGIGNATVVINQSAPTLSNKPIGGTHKERMKKLLENRSQRNDDPNDSYTPPPHEYPGIR